MHKPNQPSYYEDRFFNIPWTSQTALSHSQPSFTAQTRAPSNRPEAFQICLTIEQSRKAWMVVSQSPLQSGEENTFLFTMFICVGSEFVQTRRLILFGTPSSQMFFTQPSPPVELSPTHRCHSTLPNVCDIHSPSCIFQAYQNARLICHQLLKH